MQPLGEKIRKRRQRQALSLDDLAAVSGISKPYLSLIETGKVINPPSDEKLRTLENILKFQPGELLTQAHLIRTPQDIRAMLACLARQTETTRSATTASAPPQVTTTPNPSKTIHPQNGGADSPDFTEQRKPFDTESPIPVVSVKHPTDFAAQSQPSHPIHTPITPQNELIQGFLSHDQPNAIKNHQHHTIIGHTDQTRRLNHRHKTRIVDQTINANHQSTKPPNSTHNPRAASTLQHQRGQSHLPDPITDDHRMVKPIDLDQAYLTGLLHQLAEQAGGNVERVRLNAVPIINRVSAGYPKDFTDLSYPCGVADDYVGCPEVADTDAFAARVHGDSMCPKYTQGDIVIFSPAATCRNGDDCFVRFEDGQTTFKRVFFEKSETDEPIIRLQPRNEKYRPQIVRPDQITGIYRAMYRYQSIEGG